MVHKSAAQINLFTGLIVLALCTQSSSDVSVLCTLGL